MAQEQEKRLGDFRKLEQARLCTHCGFCLPVCPTYRAHNEEMQSPRGRVSVILAFMNGLMTKEEAGQTLSFCLSCRACHAACPAGVRVGKLVMLARSLMSVSKPWRTRLFHGITDRAWLSRPVAWMVRWYQGSMVRKVLHRWPSGGGHRWDRLIPTYRESFRGCRPSGMKGMKGDRFSVIHGWVTGEKPLRAALLCGCMGRMFYPGVATSTASLLARLGVRVEFLEGFGCCGAPHREGGDRKRFLKQAKKVLDRFRPVADRVDVVLCDSAACRVTVGGYARALAHDAEYELLARRFVEKVIDFSDLIANRCLDPETFFAEKIAKRVVFMDHCQTRNSLGVMDRPRQLLDAVAGDRVELSGGGACCGAGGDTLLSHPRHCEPIRDGRINAIMASGASIVTGTNPGCLLNVEAGFAAARHPIVVRHLAELLWESCAGEGRTVDR
ncbi:MAG: (Fe-S)-binding protein [Magnetococcales bacterium]|nr:(Fe-S)-binding protein [Magnetococcales bacterium]